jgi:hypothetical protein
MAELGIMALPRITVLDRDGPRRLAAKRFLFTGYIAVRGRHLEGPRQ